MSTTWSLLRSLYFEYNQNGPYWTDHVILCLLSSLPFSISLMLHTMISVKDFTHVGCHAVYSLSFSLHPGRSVKISDTHKLTR